MFNRSNMQAPHIAAFCGVPIRCSHTSCVGTWRSSASLAKRVNLLFVYALPGKFRCVHADLGESLAFSILGIVDVLQVAKHGLTRP